MTTGDSRRANQQIEGRSDQLVRMQMRGDTAGVAALTFDDPSRAQSASIVADFGRRPGTTGQVQVDEFGGRNGVLTVSVPCRDHRRQQFTVIFSWKRTSWVSSGWYAVLYPRGDGGNPVTACLLP